MSEFKFACPVCGQHITADSRSSGSQTECPTCFRKIVVPQAPASEDTKLILAAAQVPTPRPAPVLKPEPAARAGWPVWRQRLQTVLVVALLGGGGLAFFTFHHRLFPQKGTTPDPVPPAEAAPGGTQWSLELTNALIPEAAATGRINGRDFHCEAAVLQGGKLTLAQGQGWPPQLGMVVSFYVQDAAKLVGKALEVAPDRAPPLPRVVLHWRNEQDQGVKQAFHSGYALKLAFGQPVNGRVPGRVYIALPDSKQSFIAGTFDARIEAAPRPPRNPQ